MAEAQALAPKDEGKREWSIAVREDAMAFRPRTWQEMADFAQLVCKTDFVPDAFRGNPGAVLAAWQTGNEVGLPPMTSLRFIAVINGRPRIWGNAYWALIKNHPLCEWTKELPEHEALEKGYGECTVKRKGDPEPVTARFTVAMAEKSGVWGGKGRTQEGKEQSPWFKRPGRMLQWMARNLAGNDAVPEATLGVEIAELAEEEPRDVTPATALKVPQALTSPEVEADTKAAPELSVVGQAEPTQAPKTRRAKKQDEPEKRQEPDDQPPAPVKEPTEEDRVAELEAWLNSATDDEVMAGDEHLADAMRGISQGGQIKMCSLWNKRRAQALAIKSREEARGG
jgi:hypothetical protein